MGMPTICHGKYQMGRPMKKPAGMDGPAGFMFKTELTEAQSSSWS
jgi:hypothetical protein